MRNLLDGGRLITSLPYSEEDFEYIKDNGAVVKIKDISFNEDENENIRISLIYLRNTDFDVILDFDEVSTEIKFKYILSYIKRGIKNLSLPALDYTIMNLLRDDSVSMNILSEDEVKLFREKYSDLLNEIRTFLYSLPLYIIMNLKNKAIDQDCEVTDKEFLYMEFIINFIKYSESIVFLIPKEEVKPKYYSKYFDSCDNELFRELSKTPLSLLISSSLSVLLKNKN